MRLLYATSEIAPWVKTGGLGDVSAALPPALLAAGCDVRILVPAYPALTDAFAGRLAPVASIDPSGGALPGARLLSVRDAPGPQYLLLDAPGLFDRPGNPYVDAQGRDHPDKLLRFGLLSRVAALLASDRSPLSWRPQLLCCNDWQTALAPAFLHYLHPEAQVVSLVTIHNLAFQGLFGREALAQLGLPEAAFRFDGVEFHGALSFLKAGLQFCDRIVTVSPGYAREILTPEGGCGLDGLLRYRADRLHGILNGIDTEVWDPARDPALVAPYDAERLDRKSLNRQALRAELGLAQDAGGALLGVVGRLTDQKGLDLLLALVDDLCAQGVQIALLGSGDAALEAGWRAAAARHRGRCAAVIGFDEPLAHRIEAGADLFVMPSRFEPCGLNQLYSLRYGTPPVVRRTGGLADSVIDADEAAAGGGQGTGFVFDAPQPQALADALQRALAAFAQPLRWRAIQRAGMRQDLGWHRAAEAYCRLMRAALQARQKPG